ENIPEHDIQVYFRNRQLGRLHSCDGIAIERNTPWAKPLTPFPACRFSNCLAKHLKYQTAPCLLKGTFGQPDIDLILQKSNLSTCRRGEKTVTDPAYRNGREIPAASIAFGEIPGLENDWMFNYALSKSKTLIANTMFPGREITAKLYKLAIYEAGDSTHNTHHATLLLALNTSWKGGDLLLRQNGVETRADLQPQLHGDGPMLQAIAFYTDTEHKVESVTEGIRIVFQYDIEVILTEPKEGDRGVDEDGTTKEDSEVDDGDVWLEEIKAIYSYRQGAVEAVANNAATEEVVPIIKTLHTSGIEEVGLALEHLYRKASIRAEFLKGSDILL
ncbi:hypothetical protein PILCRDRAFT_805517, partial [Piloderma croceum F 1598]